MLRRPTGTPVSVRLALSSHPYIANVIRTYEWPAHPSALAFYHRFIRYWLAERRECLYQRPYRVQSGIYRTPGRTRPIPHQSGPIVKTRCSGCAITCSGVSTFSHVMCFRNPVAASSELSPVLFEEMVTRCPPHRGTDSERGASLPGAILTTSEIGSGSLLFRSVLVRLDIIFTSSLEALCANTVCQSRRDRDG
jgi:hypothetical protein